MSSAAVEAARALPTMSAVVTENGPLITPIEQALAAAGRRHDRARQQLLAEVDWLAAALADQLAAASVLPVVWRAEVDGIPLGTYRRPEDARAHCEDAQPNPDAQPTWYPEEDDETEPVALRMHLPGPGRWEVATEYRAVPVFVLDEYVSVEEDG
ncbi:hypothetical protein [Kitasatospora sp. CB02891]|uniref:hypothetical protein n=1 Tax=Kitasatospora sp. CB02891 TaxID=2020329 RepID=UPI0012FDE2C6|nr:hypothetical protein [Kitasatospora sp. CB02891]